MMGGGGMGGPQGPQWPEGISSEIAEEWKFLENTEWSGPPAEPRPGG